MILKPCKLSYLQGFFRLLNLPFLPTFNDFQVKTTTKINDKSKVALITEPTASKSVFTMSSIRKTIIEKTKEWGGDDEDPESRKWIEQLIWNVLL